MSIEELFEKIKLQDFSNATSSEIAKVFLRLSESETLIEALGLQSDRAFSLKQIEKVLDLYFEGLDFNNKMFLVFILMKLNILKISVSKDLLNEIEFISKG